MAISVTTAFKTALSGPVDRSQIKVEIYLGSWVDVTSYVEEISGALEEVSQLSGGASANTLNLTLINDDGRFSPKYTAGPYYGNLTPNKPIRVSAVYGSESVRMFTGYVSNWIPSAKARSCQVTAEDAARILRRKDITEETVFNDTNPTTGYYLTRVIERAAYLSGLRWDAVTTRDATWTNLDHNGTDAGGYTLSSGATGSITPTYNAGATKAVYTFAGSLVMTLDLVDLLLPCTPLKGKCLAVLDQLAKVVDGAIYFDAQGQLVFRSRMYRNDSTLTSVETLTVSSLEDVTAQVNFEDSKWSQLCNRATVKALPWAFKTDTSGAVIEEEIPFKGDLFAKYYFTAGEKYPDYTADPNAADLWCEIPNGIKLFKSSTYPTSANMVLTSVDNADATKKSNGIQFQTAADCPSPGPAVNFPVFEQTRVRVAFKNTGSTAQRIENLTLKAKLMRPIQRCQSVQKNQASIDLYDQRDKEVSNDFIPSSTACKQLAAWLVEDGRQPKDYYTLPVMYGCPWLELGDRITVSETITNTIPTATDAIIRRISWRWTLAAFVFTIEACSPAADFAAGSIPATVVNVETLNQNNQGVLANILPPAIIDGTKTLVGLNNIPTINQITSSVRKVQTDVNAKINTLCLYAGYIWGVGDQYVYKFDPLTMTYVGKWALLYGGSTAASLFDCINRGRYLYISDPTNGIVSWFDMDNPGTVQGTNWGLKWSSSGSSPRYLLKVADKLYFHGKNSSNARSKLFRFDIASTASVGSTSEIAVDTYTGSFTTITPADLVYANGAVWTTANDSGGGRVTAGAINPGDTTALMNPGIPTQLRVGQYLKIDTGASAEYVQITALAGGSVTFTPAAKYSHAAGITVYDSTTQLAAVDLTALTASFTTLDDGAFGEGLEWNGSEFYLAFYGSLVKYRLSGTTPVKASTTLYPSITYNDSLPTVLYDGSYLWIARTGAINQFDARSCYLTAQYPTDATTGSAALFNGWSILVGGNDGSKSALYQIPRWDVKAQ